MAGKKKICISLLLVLALNAGMAFPAYGGKCGR